MTTHELKCWPEFFDAIRNEEKTFDVRKGNDRVYHVGDYLNLREYDPNRKAYTGRSQVRGVGYIMHGGPWLPEDTWVLGLYAVAREDGP